MLMALGVFDVTLDRRVLPQLVCSRGRAPDHDYVQVAPAALRCFLETLLFVSPIQDLEDEDDTDGYATVQMGMRYTDGL